MFVLVVELLKVLFRCRFKTIFFPCMQHGPDAHDIFSRNVDSGIDNQSGNLLPVCSQSISCLFLVDGESIVLKDLSQCVGQDDFMLFDMTYGRRKKL